MDPPIINRPDSALGLPIVMGKSRAVMGNPSPGKNRNTPVDQVFLGADDGIRTRDPHLGKVMLYQLSHVRSGRSP
jgi:hypothetical protein